MNKKVLIVTILLLMMLPVAYVYAAEGPGNGSAGSSYNAGTPVSTIGDDGLPKACNKSRLTATSETPVGILVTVLQYDPYSGEEKILSKTMFHNGNIGMASFSNTCSDDRTAPTTCGSAVIGEREQCGDTHMVDSKLISTMVKSYGYPSYTSTLADVQKVQSPVQLNFSNMPYSLENKHGLIRLLMHMNDEEFAQTDTSWSWNGVIPKINSELGINLLKENIQQYYIKVEPVTRWFGAAFGNSLSGLGISVIGTVNTALSGEIPHEFGENYGSPHYHYKSYLKKVSASSEDDCKYIWINGGCYQNRTATCAYYNKIVYTQTTYSDLKSSIRCVSDTKSQTFARILYNTASMNAHPALDMNGVEIPGKYDYYIGPNIDTAIVASSDSYNASRAHNRYVFANGGNDTVAPNKTYGMAIYALVDLFGDGDRGLVKNCENYCSGDKNSDDYLKCAQSFCDAYTETSAGEYKTTAKRDCIIDNCKYVPNHPVDCDSNASQYKTSSDFALPEGVSSNRSITGSYCSYVDKPNYETSRSATGFNTAKKTVSTYTKTGGYIDCKRIGDATTQEVNGVTVYAYGTNNTGDSYINVACKELSSFEFKDLSDTTLKPGEGFDYYARLHGYRNCKIFFDYEQWKFDFASTYSADTIRKTLLLNKVKAYNELASAKGFDTYINGSNLQSSVLNGSAYTENDDGAIVETTVRETLELAESTAEDGSYTDLSIMKYNVQNTKTNVNSVVTEYVNKAPYTEGNKSYSTDGVSPKIKLDKTPVKSYSESSILTKDGEDTLQLFNDYNEAYKITTTSPGTRQVNRYNYFGTAIIDYEIPEVCISEDNTRKVSKAADGVCNSSRFGNSAGKRLYYTQVKATLTSDLKALNLNHIVTTSVSVYKTNLDGNNSTNAYLTGDEVCHYNVSNKGVVPNPGVNPVSCKIVFERKADSGDPTSGYDDQVCYKSDNIYLTNQNEAEVRMIIDNKSSNDYNIDSYTMTGYDPNGNIIMSVQNNSVGKIPVNRMKFTTNAGMNVSNSKVTVRGVIKLVDTKGNETNVPCESELTIAKKSSNCSIVRDSGNKRYEIVTTGSNVYVASGNTQDTSGNLLFTKISQENGHYYFPDLNPNGAEAIVAKVGDGENAEYCQYIPNSCAPVANNCYKECKDEYSEYCVYNYCRNEAPTDGYNYYPSCEQSCGAMGKHTCDYYITDERLKENYDYVSTWCNSPSNLAQTNHKDVKDCISTCYKQEGTATYRSINLNNPFPSSTYSVASGYIGGKRDVGKEWKINIDTIEEDRQSIAEGKKVEYKITLTPSTIKALNQDTDYRNNNLKDGSVYNTTTNSMNSYDSKKGYSTCSKNEYGRAYTGYCSEFIHNSNFTSAFKIVDGMSFNGERYQ
jgi:hypothetical protein